MKTFIIILFGLFMVSCSDAKTEDHLNLSTKLSGTWQASAFNGELHEVWHLNENGWMEQKGHYIEQKDTSYSARTRIEKIDTDVILFSVIKNATPKIFKATSVDDDKIIFENKDYKNPYQVTYEFIDSAHYQRTITGYENDSLVSYKFDFKKID